MDSGTGHGFDPSACRILRLGGGATRAGTKKDKAMEYGMKMLLRERIIDRGMHYLERGEIPPFALENIKGMHAAYVDLGDGDRSVNIIVERCKNLNIVNGG